MPDKSITFNCVDLDQNEVNVVESADFKVSLSHRPEDPENVNRLLMENGKVRVELLPSKGLSVGEAFAGDLPIFWDPPLNSLPNPEELDLHDELLINGEALRGFQWAALFTGGIEMLGLRNWGMPVHDEETGALLPIHGEVSNIPVGRVSVSMSDVELQVSGSFRAYSGDGDKAASWYESGDPLFEVEKTVSLRKDDPAIYLRDRITNLTDQQMAPDFGYHLQLRPRSGAKYLVPSKVIEDRSGGTLSEDHEAWQPAQSPQSREERGIIHKGLKTQPYPPHGDRYVKSLLRYPSGSGIMVVTPQAPYFLSWFSAGGEGDEAIRVPAGNGGEPETIFEKNWDGVGPEFGASALDHDGNVDTEATQAELEPSESLAINIMVKPLDEEEAQALESEIAEYNADREVVS